MKLFEGSASSSKSYQAFAAPEDILVDRDLAGEERRRLLDAWKLDLELAADPRAEKLAEMLRRVKACRRLLEQEDG